MFQPKPKFDCFECTWTTKRKWDPSQYPRIKSAVFAAKIPKYIYYFF